MSAPLNKYDLRPSEINDLVLVDRSKLCEPRFWRNNVIGAWCISKSSAQTEAARRYGSDNSFWLGIYDDGHIDHNFSSFGGMCGYVFDEFYEHDSYDCDDDLRIQEIALGILNDLIDNGILKKVD